MINNFSGDYMFLSNFYIQKIEYRDIVFVSSENAYQFAKIEPDKVTEKHIAAFGSCSPGGSKKLGRGVLMREDWDDIKISVMEDILRIKFKNPELKQKLIDTGQEELVEGNWWNDTFWGVCEEKGSNHLENFL